MSHTMTCNDSMCVIVNVLLVSSVVFDKNGWAHKLPLLLDVISFMTRAKFLASIRDWSCYPYLSQARFSGVLDPIHTPNKHRTPKVDKHSNGSLKARNKCRRKATCCSLLRPF